MKSFFFELPEGGVVRSFESVDAATLWLEDFMVESDDDLVYFQLASEGQRALDRAARGYWALEWDEWESEFVDHYFARD
jgi:hypothetical protein